MTAMRTDPEMRAASPARSPRRLVGCCLLDGGVRPSPLVEQSGRSVLDLNVGPERLLLDVWIDALGALAFETDRPVVRVLHGGDVSAPEHRLEGVLRVEVTPDTDSYRGPAGVVRDAMADLPEDCEFLVCEAGRYIAGGLGELLECHRQGGADVTIARESSGAPAGVLIVSRATLSHVAERGFVDLKEQWLGKIIGHGAKVLVCDLPVGAALTIRTRLDLLQAARVEAGASGGPQTRDGADVSAKARLARRVQAGWAISPRARVSPSAVVARSIVMEGAVIGDDAVVSSSLVMPGAVVAPGSLVMDRVVT